MLSWIFTKLRGGGGPRTDFTLCANRKKWKKNYWKLPKPLILSRGPSVPDQKDSVILAKIKKKTFRPFFSSIPKHVLGFQNHTGTLQQNNDL